MNTEYKDFIAVYKDVYPEGYCQHLIDEFERLVNSGAGYDRKRGENASKHAKNDLQLGLNFGSSPVANFNNTQATELFFSGLQRCYDAYADEFPALRDAKILATHLKMQRTDPSGGYHLWHCEQNDQVQSSRVLVYMLYLNTLEDGEGGETEFLYQRLRLKPVQNSMVLWPAAFTHTHRGNTVLGSRSKYVVTGWFDYQ